MDYTVKTRIFEGPFDLLLELIQERKLFVNDLSLAEVTDDFIKYIETHEEFPISESAEFILVASTLMLIKSRSLLPELPLTPEEEANIHDLENRLIEYSRVKILAGYLKDLYGKKIIFEKEERKPHIVFAPDGKTDMEGIANAVNQLIAALPKHEALPKVVVKKVVSLEEMISRLAERVAKAGRIYFKDFKHKDKVSVIVGFLAMLELVKRGAIRATQEGSDIQIESEAVNTPTYA